MRLSMLGAVALVLLVAAPAAAENTRVDLFKPDGTRRGHAIVNERTGRIDVYDASSRRRAYGKIQGNRIELFDNKGVRKGYGRLPEVNPTTPGGSRRW